MSSAARIGAANTLRRRMAAGPLQHRCRGVSRAARSPDDARRAARHDARRRRGSTRGGRSACARPARGSRLRRAIDSRRPCRSDHRCASVADWPPPAGSWDLLVNATPVGTIPALDETPLPDGPFTGELVYDLVYNPPETRLLRDARAAGCHTIGGLDMLVAQAERQFEWWTGHPPAPGVMRDAALRTLNSQSTLGTSGTSGTLQ